MGRRASWAGGHHERVRKHRIGHLRFQACGKCSALGGRAVRVARVARGARALGIGRLARRDGGRSGRLFRCGDPGDLAERAVDLLADDAQQQALTKAGRETVQAYDWEHVGARILAVYETVTWGGLRVREDSRGQAFGRFTRLKDDV